MALALLNSIYKIHAGVQGQSLALGRFHGAAGPAGYSGLEGLADFKGEFGRGVEGGVS